MLTISEAFRAFVRRQGWTITREKEIPSGYQLWVTDGAESIPVSFYTTGTMLIQGKSGQLQEAIRSWWAEQSLMQSPLPAVARPQAVDVARIGLDEAGKGDYFGPLVIGAVYVDARSERDLLALGVRDSKQLSDKRMLHMSEKIRSLCPHAVVTLPPERYNRSYEAFQSLDRLLAWGHAQALEQVLGQVQCDRAIADQFAREVVLQDALRERGIVVELEQRPRAEEDLAVAAASILARAAFVRWIEQASRRVGLRLPKGASDPAIVETGRRLVAMGGSELLSKVAKLHFKTTKAILTP